MAHAITRHALTGEWEVMTRGAAWHHLGQVVKDAKTWAETMELAGLNWTISRQQLELHGDHIPAWGIFRDDLMAHDKSKAFLTATSETFELIQNRYMFAFLDALVEGDDKAHYEAAGSLNGGLQVWALINLGISFEIGSAGDRFQAYLVFIEDRTGKRKAKCFITLVRVVCANTMEAALSGVNNRQAVSFRHDGTAAQKMNQAVNLFTGAKMDVGLLTAKLERLAEIEMTKDSFKAIFDELFPPKDEESADTVQRQNRFRELISIFDHNDDNMFPAIRGTAYNLLNAVTEYTDHFSPVKRTGGRAGMTDQQIRSSRAMFGDGADMKGRALEVILEQTANNPTRASRTIIDLATRQSPAIDLSPASLLDAVLDKGVSAKV